MFGCLPGKHSHLHCCLVWRVVLSRGRWDPRRPCGSCPLEGDCWHLVGRAGDAASGPAVQWAGPTTE